MKKNIFIYLLLMLPALLMTSCMKDQEDLFDKSASIRSAEYLENARKVLTSAEYGWVLDYFPHSSQTYGGYSYTLKFDEQNVTVSTEFADDVTETLTTTYVLDNEDGPSIAFDTYNDYLHYFATPHAASGAGGYEAYGGDFIFIIMDISEDNNTITLKGNRSGNILYMHRLTESIVEYQEKLAAFVGDLVFDKAAGVIDGKEYTMLFNPDDRHITVVSSEEGAEDIEAPFCYDKDGFTLYEPVTIGGKKVQHFKYNEAEGSFTAVEDNSVVLTGLLVPSIVINNVGEEVVIGNPAKTLQYRFNLADKFTYTPDVDWITVNVEGKNLTITVTENTGVVERSGNITVEVDGQTATITIYQVPVSGLLLASELYVALSNVSAAAQPYFLSWKTLSDSEGENIGMMAFVDLGDPYGYGIYFTSGNYRGTIPLNATIVGEDEIQFSHSEEDARYYSSGAWYYSHGYKTLVNYLESTTFKVVVDNIEEPSYFILTDKADASKYFKLIATPVSNPFVN